MPVHPLTNVMPGLPKARLGNLVAGVESADAGTTKWAVTTYDFAVDGGAVGNINLLGSAGIPSGAVAIEAFVDVTTALTSGGAATAALSLEAAGDLLAGAAQALPVKTGQDEGGAIFEVGAVGAILAARELAGLDQEVEVFSGGCDGEA